MAGDRRPFGGSKEWGTKLQGLIVNILTDGSQLPMECLPTSFVP